ncbi:MAG TPA: cytochrome P460 family protein [Gaiellaceae bacterium]|nr:cytochrome P460 family protein [Gaiellaceae bacterium]
MPIVPRVLATALLTAAAVVGATVAQARGDAKPLPGLPAWTAGYTGWAKVNRAPIPPRASDAHRGTKNVFASRRARRGVYPVGTVIVKEVRRPGERHVGVVAAMRKLPGRKAHHGWAMTEWTRSSTRDRFGILAQGAVCFGCHVAAKPDYVFTKR